MEDLETRVGALRNGIATRRDVIAELYPAAVDVLGDGILNLEGMQYNVPIMMEADLILLSCKLKSLEDAALTMDLDPSEPLLNGYSLGSWRNSVSVCYRRRIGVRHATDLDKIEIELNTLPLLDDADKLVKLDQIEDMFTALTPLS
jgi:hypothetical protein